MLGTVYKVRCNLKGFPVILVTLVRGGREIKMVKNVRRTSSTVLCADDKLNVYTRPGLMPSSLA